MSKKILVIYYTQSGQLGNIIDNFTSPLIKDGNTVATTATLDDKSLTVNYSFKRWFDDYFALQLTASGTSDDGVLDIFSNGKYKRTLTGGINFNIFPKNNTGNYFMAVK